MIDWLIPLGGDDLRTVELGEDRAKSSTVPVIRDSTAVVTLTGQVFESLVLHLSDTQTTLHQTHRHTDHDTSHRQTTLHHTDRHTDHATSHRQIHRPRYITHTDTQTTLHHTDRHTDHATPHTQTHRPRYITQTDTQTTLHHTDRHTCLLYTSDAADE